MQTTWHTLTAEKGLETLETPRDGISSEEAARRLEKHGRNELVEKGVKSVWAILWEQLSSIMVVILIVAAILSAVLGDFQDAGVILAIVVFFVGLGVFQEYRAEKAIAALKALAVPNVRVRRNGSSVEIPAPELVPGDLLELEAGDLVPADARVLECHSLKAQEAALTGESEAVAKTTDRIEAEDAPLGDRVNMLYMGTNITYGRGVALVTGTGMNTELGHIAEMLQNVETGQTPLQKRLDGVGKTLAILAVVFSALIFAIGIFRQEEWRLMLMSAISVAVAAVPEGLPAVLTITLAFGSQRMLKRHALVRKLTGIETLGSVSVICSDKTGTLTQNVMTVTHLVGSEDTTELNADKSEHQPDSAQSLLLLCGVLCNDSEIEGDKERGDPTEVALLRVAERIGIKPGELKKQMPRSQELPFDSDRKRMSTAHALNNQNLPEALNQALALLPEGSHVSFTKGSMDSLLELSTQALKGDQWVPMDDQLRQHYEDANQTLAGDGRRVLGFALKVWPHEPNENELEADLSFIGLMGMIDPPRPEVFEAVKVCKTAGIRPVMITGDHPLTASRIAKDLGITDNDKSLTGREIQNMDQAALQKALADTSVFARVSPEHKLRIVEALQAQKQVVAMTGDGVNDAPALKKADIGVAMGITGTDVSKEAADMVLQDDNFATIVAAVEEGRIIYDNLRKFIKFSVAGNLGKILAMLVAPLLGMPLALQPIQMLWLNLMTDGLLGFGLGLEQAEKSIMERKPTPPDDSILGGAIRNQIIWMGLLIGGISMGLTAWFYFQDAKGPWQTVLFTSLAVAQIFQALAIRSSSESLFKTGFSNRVLWGMLGLVIVLQLTVTYVPMLQNLFHIKALSAFELLLIVGANSLILWIAEGLKAAGKTV